MRDEWIGPLPWQFIARWDPGSKSKKGEDCFSIASQYTPSRLRARDGSIKIVAGGDAHIYASLLSAADDILIEAESIKASARGESYLGKVSINNSKRKRTIKKEADIVLQRVRIQSGGNARFIARQNIDVVGGTIMAALEVEFNGENVSLRPIQIIAENKEREYGSRGFSYYDNNQTYSTTEVATTDVIANRIKLLAHNDINIKASILMAMEEIQLTAGNDINVVEELVTHYVNSSQFEGHLKFFGQRAMQRAFDRDFRAASRAFENEFSNLVQMKRLIQAKHGVDYAAEGIKAAMSLYNEYKAIKAAGGLGNYFKKAAVEKLLSSSAEIAQTKSKKEWVEAILPVMKAKEILMKAGRNINLRGLQAKADKMSLQAQNAINIQAAQDYYKQHQSRRNLGVHGHVNFDPEKGEFLAPTIGVSAGYASCESQDVKNKNAHIDVQTFEAITPGTIAIEGANINATDVKLVAHALRMRSLVDSGKGRNQSISGGLDLNLATGGLSGHIEGSRGHHSYAQVGEQTGIKALGTFIAEIGDMTHLQGAFIDAVNGTLKTARFHYEDVEEHHQSRDINFGIGDFEFMRNAAFVAPDTITPDMGFKSQNRKERLKSGVSSGVQIITQSDVSGLNHDLFKARELVKNHKHYVRVVVPIPLRQEVWASIDDTIRSLFESAETSRERREVAAYQRIFDEIQDHDDLTESEKAQAFQAASDMINQVKKLDHEIQESEAEILDKLDLGNEVFNEEKEKSAPIYVELKDDRRSLHISHGHRDVSEAPEIEKETEEKIEENLPITDLGTIVVTSGKKLGILHKIAEKVRDVQEVYQDFKESQPKWLRNTINTTMGILGFCAGGPLKKIGQKVAAIAMMEGLDAAGDNLIETLRESESDELFSLEYKLKMTREDTLTYTELLLGGAIYKATKAGKTRRLHKDDLGHDHPRVKDKMGSEALSEAKTTKPVKEMEDPSKTKRSIKKKDGFLNEKSVEFSKYWKKSVEFKGTKVYQRNDLIDPKKVDRYGVTNLQNMKDGYAPLGPDGKKINLHHILQSDKDAIAEVSASFHQKHSKVIHINDPQKTKSGINRSAFDSWKENYWMARAKDFE